MVTVDVLKVVVTAAVVVRAVVGLDPPLPQVATGPPGATNVLGTKPL